MGSTVMFGGAPKCVGCTKSVYIAEQVIGPGGAWHKQCLKCKNCNKTLSAGQYVDAKGEPYCKACHSKVFKYHGPADHLSPISPTSSTSASSMKVEEVKQVKEVKPVQVETVKPKVDDVKDTPKDKEASPKESFESSKDEVEVLTKKVSDSSLDSNKKSPTEVNPAFASLGRSNTICGGCNKTVYAVELVQAAGRNWHKPCLKCNVCKKTVRPNELTDSKDGEIFCKHCYGAVKGPHGFRAGSTSVTLSAPR